MYAPGPIFIDIYANPPSNLDKMLSLTTYNHSLFPIACKVFYVSFLSNPGAESW